MIWASPSHITLAIWVRVRVTEDAHITSVLGMGCPKRGDADITVTAPSFLIDTVKRVKHVNRTRVSRNVLPGERNKCVHLTRL